MPIRYATVHRKAGRKKTNFLTPTKIENWAKITKISPKNSLSESGVGNWPANQSIIPLDLKFRWYVQFVYLQKFQC